LRAGWTACDFHVDQRVVRHSARDSGNSDWKDQLHPLDCKIDRVPMAASRRK
jgi:hypothetical protein